MTFLKTHSNCLNITFWNLIWLNYDILYTENTGMWWLLWEAVCTTDLNYVMSDFNSSGKDQKSTWLILSGIKYPFDTCLAMKFDLRWQKPTRNPVHEHCSLRALERCSVPPDLIYQSCTAVILFHSPIHYVMNMY